MGSVSQDRLGLACSVSGAHIVCEQHRAHRMAGAQLHRDVDVLDRGVAAVNHRERLRDSWHEQAVHNEAWRVLARDNDLVREASSPRLGRGEDGRVSVLRGDDFDELHQLDWVEEVQTNELACKDSGAYWTNVVKVSKRG